MKKKKHGGRSPHAIPRFSRSTSNYDLHEMAGGLPLAAFSAPSVHHTSARGREVCNPAVKILASR